MLAFFISTQSHTPVFCVYPHARAASGLVRSYLPQIGFHACVTRQSGQVPPVNNHTAMPEFGNVSAVLASSQDPTTRAGQIEPSTTARQVRARGKEQARTAPRRRANAKPKAAPKPKPLTKWGRCWMCQRGLVPRLRRSDGNPFLSCPRWPWCTFARSMPVELAQLLPEHLVVRQRVDF